MKKTIYLKSIILLCALLTGFVNAHADDWDYEWVKITDLSEVGSGETVLLVDVDKSIALPNNNSLFTGVSVTINDNGTIDDGSFDNIKWTLGKEEYAPLPPSFTFKRADGQYLYGVMGSDPKFEVGAIEGDRTNSFNFYDYGENGGELYFNFSNYLKWAKNGDNYRAVVGTSGSNITLYKRVIKNYVKWKRVNGIDVTLNNNDVVVIVDLTTGRAMSNDKKDKDPDAVAVTLNDDKDRICSDVEEKVQWSFTKNGGNYKFAVGENNLYANSEGLKVGTETTNNEFDFSNNENGPYMGITIDNTAYFAGVDASMFSNVWKLVTEDDDMAKNTQVAIFKKIEDPQKVVKIELTEYYSEYLTGNPADDKLDLKAKITGAEFSEISWSSSDTNVATVANGIVTLKKRGSVVITASVGETTSHDKASAKCTVVIDDKSTEEPGSLLNPLTVAQAKELAEQGSVKVGGKTVTRKDGVYYYIKGKVSKVNSGLMAMFGDMDFGSMGGGDSGMNMEEEMDDIDFDMSSMEEMGIDMSSMGFDISAFFGSSDKVTYYVSDDGTKDNQLKVLNGRGGVKTIHDGAYEEFYEIPNLSPGDCVILRGPLVYSEDTNMFSSMMGGGDDEPKMSWKVGEMNHLIDYDPTLLVTKQEREVYVNKSLGGDSLYTIDNIFEGYPADLNEAKFPEGTEIQPATFKSSDEEIAKWDEEKKELVGVNVGTAKITVKVKVILQKADDTADPKVEEKSYTMKRKFKLNVLTRDLDPAGYYDGDYVLTTSTDDLEEGTRLILVGTRVKDGNETDYLMVENNAMMGGGKNGSKIEIKDTNKEKIPCEDVVSKSGQEVILEKDGDFWNLKVGIDEKNTPLYLYATAKTSTEDSTDIMEMFSSSTGLKVGTKEDAAKDAEEDSVIVSLKASINFSGVNATIKFDGISDDKNNTIMLTSSFDMEEMMNMFNKEGEGEEGGDSIDMGGFDMFMAAFNTKKPGDEIAAEGKAPKCFIPRIYRFVPDSEFDISIGNTGWRTIITYKDVEFPNDIKAYIVTKVQLDDIQSFAILKPVEKLKGGEPYLLNVISGGTYTMTLTDEFEDPSLEENKLKKSDRTTTGSKGNTTVYVLANKSLGVGFYRWIGEELGAGRVYLNVTGDVNPNAHEFVGFTEDDETTAIDGIENTGATSGIYYDLQGRRVLNPTKGVYILNGKKVIIK